MIDLDDPGHSDDLFVSTDKKLLDHRWLVTHLLGQPWASTWTHERLHEAVANSLCFGAYRHTAAAQPGSPGIDTMIAFARAITDSVTYSVISDVVVAPEHQNRGIGSFLVANIVSHPQIVRTVCVLRTNSPAAEAVYHKFGFTRVSAMRRVPA